MSHNLFGFLSRHFPADPDRLLLETPQGWQISYREMTELTGRIANALVAQGLEPGDRVAVQVEKSPEALALYLATVRAGGVFLPLNTAYTLTELAYFFGDAEPRVIVCRPQLEGEVRGAADNARVLTLGEASDGSLMEHAAATAAGFADVQRGPDDLAAILYTSGTTGRSKGAMLTTTNLASNAEVLCRTWRFTSEDVLLHPLPIFHTHGLFTATNTLLVAGGAMLFLPRFDVEQVLRLLPRATTMMGVPTFYTRLLAEPRFTHELVDHLRLFISGSAPLLAETHKTFFERTGKAILERYGMTETGMLTSNPYDGERIAGTVGFPLDGVELRIADAETGEALPQGEIGIIEVRGPNVSQGYWRMPEKTKAEFREDGFFITGDVGKVDARGYVHIVGRAKDLIISGGYNVYPKEVESELDALPGVDESAVFGVPHPDFGEAVTAVVVAQPGTARDEAQLIEALAIRLAKYKLPKRVFAIDSLPRNTMGKVQKNLLRDRYKELFTKS
jgi:malonyl-CoA/methylmalonyl-CoA synthetase